MALYLGLDSSTQSLTALVLEVEHDGHGRSDEPPRKSLVFEHSISFDENLPLYGTRHGVLPSEDPSVAVSSPPEQALELGLVSEVLPRQELLPRAW